MSSGPTDEYQTPPEVFGPWNERFRFRLDAAATKENALAESGDHFTKKDNALKQSWRGRGPVWVNPPFSQPNIPAFLSKAKDEALGGETVVCLVPCDTSTAWWHGIVLGLSGQGGPVVATGFDEASGGLTMVRRDITTEIHYLAKRTRFLLNGKRQGSPKFPTAIVVFRP